MDGEKVSLTDMWKASGSKIEKRVNHWLENKGTQEFIETVCKKLNIPNSVCLKIQRGRYNGGTYAHWQIALAYAKYLSPEIHMAFNQIVKERFEEEVNPELGVNRAYEQIVLTRFKLAQAFLCIRVMVLYQFHKKVAYSNC